MNGSVITVVVSKGSCHYQPYIENGKPMSKPKVLHDTIDGFEDLSKTIDKLKEKSGNDDVSIIFEATGVYHRCLQKYLDDNKVTYYIISPLMSAAYCKTNINANKTDDLDCGHIAKCFYGEQNLRVYKKQESIYEELRHINRYYESELNFLRQRKTAFRSLLDIIYPRIDKCFKGHASLYDEVPMAILRMYPHPKLILKHKEESIVKSVEPKSHHNKKFVGQVVHKIYEAALKCYSGCDENDEEVIRLKESIISIQEQEIRCNTILEELINKAMVVPYFKSVASITGIGLNLASRIVAEIGDIARFGSRRAITAYVGLNPKIRQSGDIDGTHLAISKKSNRHLRSLLYLGVSCNYRLKKDDKLYEFNQKKRQQSVSPLKNKAANIATAHKLLVIIYALSKNQQEYNS